MVLILISLQETYISVVNEKMPKSTDEWSVYESGDRYSDICRRGACTALETSVNITQIVNKR